MTRLLRLIVMAWLIAASAPWASAQSPAAGYMLYPPNLHLVPGETSSVPLGVRDRDGNPVPGAVTFSGFDPSLISVSAAGYVTALRGETATERGTWVTATFAGQRIANTSVVRVLSSPRPEPFAFVTRQNTALYYPTTIAGEDITALVDRYQMADVNEYAFLAQQRLTNVALNDGARQIIEVDFSDIDSSQGCGISGNPTRILWAIQGTAWQNCFLVPYLSPRSPVWFTIHHELGHEFLEHAHSFSRGLGGNRDYNEGLALAFALSEIGILLRTPALYPMGADARASLTQQLTQHTTSIASSVQAWQNSGAPFSQVNADVIAGIFLRHGGQRPNDFAERFFLPLQPAFSAQLDSVFDQMGPDDPHTIFAALVSAAAGRDLSGVFTGTYHYPLNGALFASAAAAFNQILVTAGAPGSPSGLVASSTGNVVGLAWAPPGSGGPPAGYVIEAGSAPGQSDLANVATNSSSAAFSASGVPDGGYFVRVRAANAFGASGPSNEVSLRVGFLPPGPPSGLTATSAGANVTLSWNAPSTGDPATTYVIEAGSGPGQSNIARFPTGTTATSFSSGGVPNGTYYVRVRAANPGGQSQPSNEAMLVVGCSAAPGTPGNLRITGNSGGNVSLAWDAASGNPASYVLQAGTSAGSANLGSFNLGPVTTFATSGVPARTYFLRVIASNACGASAASNEVELAVR